MIEIRNHIFLGTPTFFVVPQFSNSYLFCASFRITIFSDSFVKFWFLCFSLIFLALLRDQNLPFFATRSGSNARHSTWAWRAKSASWRQKHRRYGSTSISKCTLPLALPFFSPSSFHTISLSPAFISARWIPEYVVLQMTSLSCLDGSCRGRARVRKDVPEWETDSSGCGRVSTSSPCNNM